MLVDLLQVFFFLGHWLMPGTVKPSYNKPQIYKFGIENKNKLFDILSMC